MLLSPDEAREMIGRTHLPIPIFDLAKALDWRVEPNPDLQRSAISYIDISYNRRVARYRPGDAAVVREALTHEFGHYGSGHPGQHPQWCGYKPWRSADPLEREAHWWMEEYLLPLGPVRDYIDLGGRPRITRLADFCKVTVPTLRRRLERDGIYKLIWDDGDQRSGRPRHQTLPLPLADPLLA